MKTYDAIIIGSGQAGNPLARQLASKGWKTALIEQQFIGGTCINNGCTPTKALIASAKMAFMASRSIDFGVTIEKYGVDLPAIIDRKNKIVSSFRNGLENNLKETPNLDLLFGKASFIDQKSIAVALKNHHNTVLTADYIFINTGTKITIPEIPGLSNSNYLTSASILELQKIPEHLLILGGSYVGLEFGQMFSRFGSKITILDTSPHFLSHEDEDVAEEIKRILEEEGVRIYLNAEVQKIEKQAAERLKLTVNIDEKIQDLSCSHILIAAGREPQTTELNLEKAEISVDEKGFILVNNKLETNVPGIYALGDVKGGPAFTHIAYNDYRVIVKNLLENLNVTTDGRQVPYCMFIDPQLGRVGLTESEARKKGLNIKVAKILNKNIARAIETGETCGLLKAIINAENKQIIGVAALGAEGGEMLAVLQMAMLGRVCYDTIRDSIFSHPTYSEALNTLFSNLKD